MKRVAIAGKFDPCHDGHIDHIIKTGALGNYLIVITHDDETVKKVKDHCNVPLWARRAILEGLLLYYHIEGSVVISIDTDGTVTNTLKTVKPHIFAKGGDRTPDNMPENEIKVCEEIGCEIRYGIGDLLNTSPRMETKKGGRKKDTRFGYKAIGSKLWPVETRRPESIHQQHRR